MAVSDRSSGSMVLMFSVSSIRETRYAEPPMWDRWIARAIQGFRHRAAKSPGDGALLDRDDAAALIGQPSQAGHAATPNAHEMDMLARKIDRRSRIDDRW